MLGDFDRILPSTITDAAVRSGIEWVIPLVEAKQGVNLANEHFVAVLGVESFHILENGFGVEAYTGYAFDLQGDWPTFVRQNNNAALRFIEEYQFGQGYGYILTTSSEDEFKRLVVRKAGRRKSGAATVNSTRAAVLAFSGDPSLDLHAAATAISEGGRRPEHTWRPAPDRSHRATQPRRNQ